LALMVVAIVVVYNLQPRGEATLRADLPR